jgi:hypothetical protein
VEVFLSEQNLQDLEVFEALLCKEKDKMINEALKLYFKKETQRLEEEKNSQTNLSFEEFWDDVDL